MFKDIFVELLQQKGKTAYRAAKETGISQGLMNQYKTTTENLIKIADYLDCSVDILLGHEKAEIIRSAETNLYEQLLSAFRRLTADGQEVALNQVEALGSLQQYQKYTDSSKSLFSILQSAVFTRLFAPDLGNFP